MQISFRAPIGMTECEPYDDRADLFGLIRFGHFRPWNDWPSFHDYIVRPPPPARLVAAVRILILPGVSRTDQGPGPRCAAGRRACSGDLEAHLATPDEGFETRGQTASHAPAENDRAVDAEILSRGTRGAPFSVPELLDS